MQGIKYLIFGLLSLMLAGAPAHAQERVQDEAARSDFIYRVNLGRADDVRLMIRQGASPNQVNGEGVPVLCLAAGRVDPEAPEVLHALLDAGANLNGRDSKGQTALFYAAKAGNNESINYLLDAGIDMYAIDNNGDVARTAAHKAGQTDAIKAMDDYVLRATAQITQQYNQQSDKGRRKGARRTQQDSGPTLSPATSTAAPDATLAAPPAPVPAPTPAPAAPAPAAPEEAGADNAKAPPSPPAEPAPPSPPAGPAARPQPVASPTATAPSPEELAAQKEAEEAERARKDEEMKGVIYDMSFNICAFQYWYYCSTAKQSTDLEQEELIIAIESSQTKAEKLQKQLITQYKLPKSYVEGIAASAQSRIFRELNNMASNRDRHENGVGKRDDMQERCELIARQWGVKAIGNADEELPVKGAPASNSKSGSKGGNKGAPITTTPSNASDAGGRANSKSGSKGGKGSKSGKRR